MQFFPPLEGSSKLKYRGWALGDGNVTTSSFQRWLTCLQHTILLPCKTFCFILFSIILAIVKHLRGACFNAISMCFLKKWLLLSTSKGGGAAVSNEQGRRFTCANMHEQPVRLCNQRTERARCQQTEDVWGDVLSQKEIAPLAQGNFFYFLISEKKNDSCWLFSPQELNKVILKNK